MLKAILPLAFLLCAWQAVYCQYNKRYFDNYTTENGLSDNYVNCIMQDHKGWIWLGSGMGVQRFDGISFKHYTCLPNDSMGNCDYIVRQLFEDSRGDVYACIEDLGLIRLNRGSDAFERVLVAGMPILTHVSVKDITEDDAHRLWAATKQGVYKIDFDKQEIKAFAHDSRNISSLSGNYVRKLAFDVQGKLWIGTQKGLDKLDPVTNRIVHLVDNDPNLSDEILELYRDSMTLWVGTSNKGVYTINTNSHAVSKLMLDAGNERSNKVNTIVKDADRKFWIGTRGGLYAYEQGSGHVEHYQQDLLDDNSLVHNSVIDIFIDEKQDMWIGTRSGLSYLVQEKQVFETYKALPNSNRHLNDNELYAIWVSEQGEIWMGTEAGGVNILNRTTGKLRYLTKKDGLSSQCIKSINSLGNGKVMIGSFQGGLDIYDDKTGKITNYRHRADDPNSLSSNVVWSIHIDRSKTVWLGTESGLDRFDPLTGKFYHYRAFDSMVKGVSWICSDHDNDLWIGSQTVKVFRPGKGIVNEFSEKSIGAYCDQEGRVWIMTPNRGIVQYDKNSGLVKAYSEQEGLASKLTYCMLEDAAHKLWISTADGLSCFDPQQDSFNNYYNTDGLLAHQFNYGASAKLKTGELLFGGKRGLTVLKTSAIKPSLYLPKVYLTDFKIFNNSVPIGKGADAILTKSISETKELRVPYKFNVLSFEFAALNYTNAQQNRYRYFLEGFDNDWTETSNRQATYTNLNPGEYTFKVLACNNKGCWNETGPSIQLVILPPFYKQSWFKVMVFLLLLGLIILIFNFLFKRRELSKTLEFEKMKAQKLHEVDAFKLKLFTNISHEIKTPLTLIISPLSKILKYDFNDPGIKDMVLLMDKNAKHLMKLITQLLDYRKLQEGKLDVELKRGDIVRFSRSIFYSFEGLMNEKEIQYKFGSVQEAIATNFDPDKLRNILNNLISNAIRYNQPSGSVSLLISMVIEHDGSEAQQELRYVKLEVRDTGIGIDGKEIDRVFDRYYSKSGSEQVNSSGIGLAFTKELVELHNGKLSVESKVGKGSSFTVLLPYIDNPQSAPVEVPDDEPVDAKELIKTKEFKTAQKEKRVLLVVEDNEDVLQFIKSHFKDTFIVLGANNGIDGLELAMKAIPDIIMSDVMMPGMDGKELCERIKKDERTSHIPVILLTALDAKDHIKEGLARGADDYMTKPFDMDILQSKVENMLTQQRSLKKRFSKMSLLQPSHVELKTLDEKFLEKAIKVVEKNMDDPNLNIDKFVEQMSVSRMQLYRKISALTNMTVKEFVNDIRLKRAEQILSSKKISVSEVAYGVGFNDLSYFGKCFKKKYGISPSEYNKKNTL